MIVMKFGGTSVKDYSVIRRVVEIIKDNRGLSPVVVLSACAGMTDRLLELVKTAAYKSLDKSLEQVDYIEDYHLKIIDKLIFDNGIRQKSAERISELCSELKILAEGVSLLKECTRRSLDSAAAFGEMLSSTVIEASCSHSGIESTLLDIRKVLKTDDNYTNAAINFNKTKASARKTIAPLLNKRKIIITQGFIGSAPDNSTTTLGRGGSDYSAAVLGAALESDEIQIWTDVDGVLTADPKLIEGTKTIPEMTFAEVRELSYFGAKVLHPETIKPAVRKGIPVRVLNTFNPESKGTLIVKNRYDSKPRLHAVVLMKDCLLAEKRIPYTVNSQLYSSRMLNYISRQEQKPVFSICNESNCNFIFHFADKSAELKAGSIFSKLRLKAEPVDMLCICGSNLTGDYTNINDILFKTAEIISSFMPKFFAYGNSPVSIIAAVPPTNSMEALKKIHGMILSQL